MKKFLHTFALVAMMLPLASGSLWAQEDVTIGSLAGATDDAYLPVNTLYNYSYSQQIYTADEIGMVGTIDSITLWMLGTQDLYNVPITIYMVEVDKETFESNTDWVTVSEGDIVYTDTLTVFHSYDPIAYTIVLDTPFVYSGTGNLLIAVNNTTGIWKSGLRAMVFGNSSGAARAIYARRDGVGVYDPYNPTFEANETTGKRNVITLSFTPAPCDPVTDVTVSNVTGTSATVTWTASEGQTTWEIEYGTPGHTAGAGTIVTADTNPFELTDLEPSTEYGVYVRAVCARNLHSDWSAEASINTLGIHDAMGSTVSVSPNPASSNVTISGIEDEASVMVVDMNGRTVFTANANEKLTIDLAGFAQGAYFIRICGEQTMAIRKLLVK